MPIEQVRITQKELEEIADLDREILWRTKRRDELKESVKILLIHHADIEHGRFVARLIKRVVRNVPWKKCFLEELGIEAVERVRKLFQPRIFFEVEVLEHAIPPLFKGADGGMGVGR
jgi:hypothetical protein